MRSLNRLALVALSLLSIAGPVAAGPEPVSLRSLLQEMTDRGAVSRPADPPYTCRQFSSYDRRSVSPDDHEGWFANGDRGQYLRVEERGGRQEWVMMDAQGPGAVVRIWSANPEGTLRVYLDGSETPAIEAPMQEVLGGKWAVGGVTIGDPLSGVRARGWNLYLPIPYAERCTITSDTGDSYYQINYRTYAAGTAVETYSAGAMAADGAGGLIREMAARLPGPAFPTDHHGPSVSATLAPGESAGVEFEPGPRAVLWMMVRVKADDLGAAMRQTVLEGMFDGERTIWCPLSEFFGTGLGLSPHRDMYRAVMEDGTMTCWWSMPYRRSATLRVHNLGSQSVSVRVETDQSGVIENQEQVDGLMHFHATWRHEYPIHARGGAGTADWNFITVEGEGVYVGDTLSLMNPVEGWWGEGDEKIYVDGEAFPSHFGTGTEDYYGYAWCSPEVFTHAFHSQPRCDGEARGNNRGHTTISRVRALDAIPFERSLKFDMEVWHWVECDVAYAAATFFYARPGATTNRDPQPDAAGGPIPQPPPLPPPFRMEGAIECEALPISARADGLAAVRQDMRSFAQGVWSDEAHLWVQGRRPGDFVELRIPAPDEKPRVLTLHATKSWDYGIVRISVGGRAAGEFDLYSGERGRCTASGPLRLGEFAPVDGVFVLRAEVVGAADGAEGSGSFFGLDAVVLSEP